MSPCRLALAGAKSGSMSRRRDRIGRLGSRRYRSRDGQTGCAGGGRFVLETRRGWPGLTAQRPARRRSLRHALAERLRQRPELGGPVVELLLPQLERQQAPEATPEGGALCQPGQGQLVVDVGARKRSLGRQSVHDEAVGVAPGPEVE